MQASAKIRNLAIAFLNIADKQNKPEEIVSGLIQFYDVYSKDKNLKTLLYSKRIALEAKKDVLQKSFGTVLHASVIEFISFLAAEKSMKMFKKIVRCVEKEYKIRNNIVDVHVQSSQSMDADSIKEIQESIRKKDGRTANISTLVDETILGGIKLRIGNTIVDGSVANKLNQLKNTLLNSRN